MRIIQKHYDRVLLALIAAITLVAGTTLTMKSFAFEERFTPIDVPDSGEFEVPELEGLGTASDHLDVGHEWIFSPESPGLDSTRIYSVEGELIGLYTGPPLRGGIPSPWFPEHDLPIERNDVLLLDPDGDGFPNGEEYEGKTDPNDPESHPDLLLKLSLARVTREKFSLLLRNQADGDSMIAQYGDTRLKKRGYWLKVGEEFADGRYKLVAAGENSATVVDTRREKEIELTKGVTKELPIYRAVFDYPISPADFHGKQFGHAETLAIPDSKIRCKVVEIDASSVTLAVERNGEDAEILTLRAK